MKNISNRVKVIMVGPASSGKSTILSQIKYEELISQKYSPTIGVNLGVKSIEYNSEDIVVHFWDTAGQERFDAIVSIYYRDVDLVLLVFDLNDKETNEELIKYWVSKIYKLSNESIPIILIGNKKDLTKNTFLNESLNLNFDIDNENNTTIVKYFEISAIDSDNVKYLIDYISNFVLNKIVLSKKNGYKKVESVNDDNKVNLESSGIYSSIKKFFTCSFF